MSYYKPPLMVDATARASAAAASAAAAAAQATANAAYNPSTRTVIVDYSVLVADRLIIVNASNKTLTLPSPFDSAPFSVTIKNAGIGTTTIACSDLIDGDASITLQNSYSSVVLWHDGATWYVVGVSAKYSGPHTLIGQDTIQTNRGAVETIYAD